MSDDRLNDLLRLLRAGNRDACAIAADHIESIHNMIGIETECPCCEQRDACEDGCTFAEDAPPDYERMEFVREALRVPEAVGEIPHEK